MSGLTDDWDILINLLGSNPIARAVDLTKRQIIAKGVSMVQKGIQSGAPGGSELQPLTDFTIKRKGSSKPLIDNGDLIGSIAGKDVGDGVWIGARRGVKAKNGKDAADIADVHEFGRTIRVTPKMRAYLHSIGIHLNPATEYIHIPERSFLRATIESPEFAQMRMDVAESNIKAVLKI